MNARLTVLAAALALIASNAVLADSYATRVYTTPQYDTPGGPVGEPAPAHTRRAFRPASEAVGATREQAPLSSDAAPSGATRTLRVPGYTGTGAYGYGVSGVAWSTDQRCEGLFGTTARKHAARPSRQGDRPRTWDYHYRSTRSGHDCRHGHGIGTVIVLPGTYCCPCIFYYGCPNVVYYSPYNVICGHSGNFYFQFVW